MSNECIINVFQYWGQGLYHMPSFLKTIYKHNVNICKDYNINLILIDDNNVYNYIKPHTRFKSLAYNFKSDIIRYYILHKYGGFWFDTDVIIIKNLHKLYQSICTYECMLDVEYRTKIGCASLFIKKQSTVSKFCINYIDTILNKNQGINWMDIGPDTATQLYRKYPSLTILNNYDTVKNACNFICWNMNPGTNKHNWYLPNTNTAKIKAGNLKKNDKCFYLITWTIYRYHDMGKELNRIVFEDNRSVFSYFVENHENNDFEYENKYVEHSYDEEWNGTYIEYNVHFKDVGTLSYAKDDKHHLYKYNGIWTLGENGVKVYKRIEGEIDNYINLGNQI